MANNNDLPLLDLSKAPNPSRITLHNRQNVLIQAVKFAGFSLNTVMMVIKGH